MTKASQNSVSRRAAVFHKYAIFAERQYSTIVKSPDFLRWKVYVDRKRTEIKNWDGRLSRLSQGSSEYNAYRSEKIKAEKVLEQDLKRSEEFDRQRDVFLEQATDMYSRALSTADDFDEDSPIRFCSLWFANFERPGTRWQASVGAALNRVPSRKFVFLAHQLSARLSKSENGPSQRGSLQQDNLQGILLRMCKEHPFHTLYPVYTLRADQSSTSNSSRRQSSRHEPLSSQAQAERAAAAIDIFDRLRHDRTCGERVITVELVCDASVEVAKFPIKPLPNDAASKGRMLPSHLKILKLQDVKVPVITAYTPIDVTGRYENCVWISKYHGAFETAGGINLPKIMRCIGTDGVTYKQLVSCTLIIPYGLC
jgi:serine-protein kinase ATM